MPSPASAPSPSPERRPAIPESLSDGRILSSLWRRFPQDFEVDVYEAVVGDSRQLGRFSDAVDIAANLVGEAQPHGDHARVEAGLHQLIPGDAQPVSPLRDHELSEGGSQQVHRPDPLSPGASVQLAGSAENRGLVGQIGDQRPGHGDHPHVSHQRSGLRVGIRCAHRHHVPAAGDKVAHDHDDRLLFSQPAGLDVQAFAGRGAAAGGGQLDDHRLDRVVPAGIVEIFAHPNGGPLGDDGMGQTYHTDVGPSGGHVEEDQGARRNAQDREDRRQDEPSGKESSYCGKDAYGSTSATLKGVGHSRQIQAGGPWSQGSRRLRRLPAYIGALNRNVDRTVTFFKWTKTRRRRRQRRSHGPRRVVHDGILSHAVLIPGGNSIGEL